MNLCIFKSFSINNSAAPGMFLFYFLIVCLEQLSAHLTIGRSVKVVMKRNIDTVFPSLVTYIRLNLLFK